MSLNFCGNRRIIESVNSFIESRRFPHALLITGESGTGKSTLAEHLAKAYFCNEANAPCDKCRACRLVITRNHPDIMYVRPEEKKKNISVSQIREIVVNAYIKPHSADRKVFIIEKAETLSEQCQNALLKVLEEPPGNVLFILVSTGERALLPTILSRCVGLSLLRPEIDEAVLFLKEKLGLPEDEIRATAEKYRGNIGKALEFFGNSKKDKSSIAKDFLELLLLGKSEYSLLSALTPLEKDRIGCGEFMAELKLLIADKIRESIDNSRKIKKLNYYYSVISEAEPSLVTNINLSLLLSALVCSLKNHGGRI